jgi:hypothetical protein
MSSYLSYVPASTGMIREGTPECTVRDGYQRMERGWTEPRVQTPLSSGPEDASADEYVDMMLLSAKLAISKDALVDDPPV